MGKKNKKKEELSGGWESIHAVIWLLGLAVIAWQGWWWPGILVLVAISILFEAFAKKVAPGSVRTITEDDRGIFSETVVPPPAPVAEMKKDEPDYHRADLLPTNCPKCGGPTRGFEVIWTGPQSADCPFCGTNLPMKQS